MKLEVAETEEPTEGDPDEPQEEVALQDYPKNGKDLDKPKKLVPKTLDNTKSEKPSNGEAGGN